MRKKFALLVGALLTASTILTGCGSNETASNKDTTIKYVTYSAGPDHNKDLENMIAEFEKQNEGIKVEYEIIGYNDYFTKLQTQASSKTLPDVFEINYENFVTYAENGVLLDLSKLAEDDKEFSSDLLSEDSYEYFKYNDKLFGLT